MAQLHRIALTRRELATVLAALRYYQRVGLAAIAAGETGFNPNPNEVAFPRLELPEHQIATDAGALRPMTADSIDDLCLRLNNTTRDKQLPDPQADDVTLTSPGDIDLINRSRKYDAVLQKGGRR